MCFSLFSKRKTNTGVSSSKYSSSSSSTSRKLNSADKRTPMPKPTSGGSNNHDHRHPSHDELFNNASSSSSTSSAVNKHKHKPSNSYSSQFSTVSSRTSLSSIRDSLPENPQIYDLSQIQSATKNFRRPTHSSSSSISWTCSLNSKEVIITQRKLRCPNNTPTALRDRLHRLSRSHHAGLVRLLGASISGDFVYIVYERVEGISLSECLRNKINPNFTVLSSWLSRVHIAAGLADALDYLHNSSGVKGGFVHNHVKSSSIVITQEPALAAKLCHFGTAQICGEPIETGGGGAVGEVEEVGEGKDLKSGVEVRLEGTMGYMSPEMKVTGVATKKSDVYAFGVVLLELLTGEEPLKFERGGGLFRRVSLVETAREVVMGSSGGGGMSLRKWVDWRLKDSFPVGVVERMVRLAVECCEEDPSKRPDMVRVAGSISKRYLESNHWAESMGVTPDFTVSYGPR